MLHRGLISLLAALAALAGCGGSAPDIPPPPARDGSAPASGRLFAPDSPWNTPIPEGAALDPGSAAMVAELNRQVEEVRADARGPWLGSLAGSTPIYRVPDDQPTVRVTLDTEIPMSPREAFAAVPLPADAAPARGDDHHLTVWQPGTDKLWEFFQMRRQADGWHARWGGAIRRVSESPGYYTSDSWPGGRWYWGATATSLPVAAGVIRADELSRGRIDHALALNLLRTRADEYAWPAQRTDGLDRGPGTIPEGARLRIDPAVDLDDLGLPPAVHTIAVAAQRYGLIVRDKSATVSLYAEDPRTLAENPFPGLFGSDYPSNMHELIGQLPWDSMQVLELGLCRSRTAAQLRAARDRGSGGCPPGGD